MAIAFYLASLVAIIATIRVITNASPIHALLYMVISLLAVAMIFFCLGAPFAGALEIIVYAGAIMILFVFAVMMLNLGEETRQQEKRWLTPHIWVGPTLLAVVLFGELAWTLWSHHTGIGGQPVGTGIVDAKQVGISLFGPYLLLVELASILLLAALIAAYHLGKEE
ncbi:MAG TPA: NADH-quinone oxidoreductase subunit J [Halioglobus sp.]